MDVIAHRTRSRKRHLSPLIRNNDEKCYDILECFPILICQYVFQHLNAKELLEMTTVNREWNKLVGERSQMKKIKTVFTEYNERALTDKAIKILMNSQRKYQHIKFVRISHVKSCFYLQFLSAKAGSWKSADIKSCEITKVTLLEILEFIEPEIEELSITDMHCLGELMNLDLEWTFPNLKHLECVLAFNDFKYFNRCSSLVKFRWSSISSVFTSTDIRKILQNNHQLEEIYALSDGRAFENPENFKFKLKKLWVSPINPAATKDILFSFLETQADTLESLSLRMQLNQTFLKLILKMPKLSSLATDTFPVGRAFFCDELAVSENTSITSLEVKFINFRENGSSASLFSPMRSLKHFKIPKIDDNVLLSLALGAPFLESIETEEFNIVNFPDGNIFPNIEKFKAQKFIASMQEPAGEDIFSKLVREEMRK